MLSVEDRYYKLNSIFLKVLGLWPYWNSKWKYVQVIAMTFTYISAIFVQLAVFFTHDCTMELVISVLSFVFPTLFMMFLYYIYYFCSNAFKEIMDHMYYDWKSFKSKAELDILDEYASLAKLITEIFTFFLFLGILLTILPTNFPLFLDIVLPLNESRGPHVYLDVEYFFDSSKYISLIAVHLMIFLCSGMLTMLAVGTMVYSYALHACAVFKIINYRMKMMVNKDVLRIPSSERERVIFERLIFAVKLHRRNLLFIDMIMGQLETPFIAIIVIGVASLSICLFRLMQALMMFNDIMDIFVSGVLVFCHICCIFLSNHIGQQVTNNNAEIFDTVYKMQWYTFSQNIQKLVLFLLRKGNKDIHLSIGGIYDASYEGFTTLTTSAISYFTVIYAAQ